VGRVLYFAIAIVLASAGLVYVNVRLYMLFTGWTNLILIIVAGLLIVYGIAS